MNVQQRPLYHYLQQLNKNSILSKSHQWITSNTKRTLDKNKLKSLIWDRFKWTRNSCQKYIRLWVMCNRNKVCEYLVYSSYQFNSGQFSHSLMSNPMDWNTPGFFALHQYLELAQMLVHWVGDAIQPSHPLSSPSLSAFTIFPSIRVMYSIISSIYIYV